MNPSDAVLTTRDTFVELVTLQHSLQPKAHSAPPSLWRFGSECSAASDFGKPQLARAFEGLIGSGAPSNATISTLSSSKTASTGSAGRVVMLHPPPSKKTDNEPCEVRELIALSSLMQVKARNLVSIGSTGHAQGKCKPCVHQNNHEHVGANPCINGALCSFCHCSHPNLKLEKRAQRREARRQGHC
jgi:hypothetical protein